MNNKKVNKSARKSISNKNQIFKYVRIACYAMLVIVLLLLKYTDSLFFTCFINEHTGLLCPTCGITRATIHLLNFDFATAISYNAYFTLVLVPIFAILLIDDIICIILNKRSFVDIIFGD